MMKIAQSEGSSAVQLANWTTRSQTGGTVSYASDADPIFGRNGHTAVCTKYSSCSSDARLPYMLFDARC